MSLTSFYSTLLWTFGSILALVLSIMSSSVSNIYDLWYNQKNLLQNIGPVYYKKQTSGEETREIGPSNSLAAYLTEPAAQNKWLKVFTFLSLQLLFFE